MMYTVIVMSTLVTCTLLLIVLRKLTYLAIHLSVVQHDIRRLDDSITKLVETRTNYSDK
jgi:hypothetical protein